MNPKIRFKDATVVAFFVGVVTGDVVGASLRFPLVIVGSSNPVIKYVNLPQGKSKNKSKSKRIKKKTKGGSRTARGSQFEWGPAPTASPFQ